MGIRMLLAMIIVGTIATCTPGSTGSPDASVSATPITSPVTDRATATQAATATAVPTETQQPTPTPEVGINQEMLHHFPKSWQEFLDNSDTFIKAPFNPIDNPVEFRQWFETVLVPALDDKAARVADINIHAGTGMDQFGLQIIDSTLAGEQLVGNPEFFWFEWQGNKYPVPMINVGINGVVTYAAALNNGPGDFETPDFFEWVAQGKKIGAARIVSVHQDFYPDFMNQMVAAGFTGEFDEQGVAFGAGFFHLGQ